MSLNFIVVKVEFFVWVTCREVKYEVVTECVGGGGVVELGEFCFFDTEFEGSWLDDEGENEVYETNEDDYCQEKLPNYAEEAATASSTSVVRLHRCHKTAENYEIDNFDKL
ncbi:unnamed protein product [Lathyrus oleraceus]